MTISEKEFRRHTLRVLDAIGLWLQRDQPTTEEGRKDAGETAVFSRQLADIDLKVREAIYPDIKFRTLFPMIPVAADAATYIWHFFDREGMAKLISSMATDLPSVSVVGYEQVQAIRSAGISYAYTMEQIMLAGRAGFPLDAQYAKMAKEFLERLYEQIIAFGDANAGLPGLLNNTNVPIVTTSAIHGGWTTATSVQIYSDLNIMTQQIWSQTKGKRMAGRLLLPQQAYLIASRTPYSDMVPTFVLDLFNQNKGNDDTRNVEIDWWIPCDTAGPSNAPRAFAYATSDGVLGYINPKVQDTLPPQARDLKMVIPTWGRIGGGLIYEFPSCCYFDGLLP